MFFEILSRRLRNKAHAADKNGEIDVVEQGAIASIHVCSSFLVRDFPPEDLRTRLPRRPKHRRIHPRVTEQYFGADPVFVRGRDLHVVGGRIKYVPSR